MSSPSTSTAQRIRVLVVGLGTMGTSHARAYRAIDGFELVGLCTRARPTATTSRPSFPVCRVSNGSTRRSRALQSRRGGDLHLYRASRAMALQALAAGAHVFCEKPLADTLDAARRVVGAAHAAGKALLIGYILRVHPVMVALRRDRPDARKAAGDADEPQPAVGRLVLGGSQEADAVDLADRRLRRALCRRDVPGDGRAAGRGACGRRAAHRRDRAGHVNYGHLHIVFDDGSVGWYEAGWGPMMSETAFFVKDMIGPKGCVSIVAKEAAGAREVLGPRRAHAHERAAHPPRGSRRGRPLRQARRDRSRPKTSPAIRSFASGSSGCS